RDGAPAHPPVVRRPTSGGPPRRRRQDSARSHGQLGHAVLQHGHGRVRREQEVVGRGLIRPKFVFMVRVGWVVDRLSLCAPSFCLFFFIQRGNRTGGGTATAHPIWCFWFW
ncbi:unnamed protein product, partial [Ectocarpus sp. 4 AP-2014]